MKRNKYTEEQKVWFIKNVKGRSAIEIIELFNKEFGILLTKSMVGNLKTKWKVKSETIGGRFKKGQVAWNKGRRWKEYMSKEKQKNSLKSSFKKGHKPQNYRVVGSERINKYGYIEIKVSGPSNWRLKHRVIYEKVNGKIPKGFKIIFLDGNKTNCDIENLELVESSELLIINKDGFYYRNKDLTKSGVLIARIKNNIIKKTKEITSDYKK